jgi:hypothetical protein
LAIAGKGNAQARPAARSQSLAESDKQGAIFISGYSMPEQQQASFLCGCVQAGIEQFAASISKSWQLHLMYHKC